MESASKRASPRIAFVHPVDQNVVAGGSDIRANYLIRELGKEFEIDYVRVDSVRGIQRKLGWITAMLHGVPPRLAQAYSRENCLDVKRGIELADLIVASTAFALPLIPRNALGKTIYDAHNLEFRVVREAARLKIPTVRKLGYLVTGSWTRRYETRLFRSCIESWSVSTLESAWIRSIGGLVRDVPNGANLPENSSICDAPFGRIAFVGSLRAAFNREGIEWFIRRIFPRIRATIPNVRLLVAGRDSEDFSAPGIDSLGYVDNLSLEVYAKSDLAIVPILSGAGTRLKVLEAMAHGLPVVSTRTGAEGYPISDGLNIVLEDEPDKFADAVIRMLEDRRWAKAIGASGREFVVEGYSWESIGEIARSAIREISSGVALLQS